MCAWFLLPLSKYEFNSCHYWSRVDFLLWHRDCWPGLAFGYFWYAFNQAISRGFIYSSIGQFACLDSVFLITPLSYASSEVDCTNTSKSFGILIAIAGGIAGVIGSRKKEANNIVPGVAIATALMPPICTAGYGLANGNVRFLLGALYLFSINCTFITSQHCWNNLMRKSP